MYKNSLKNQILIAAPSMQDSRFKESVILLCEHNDDGAFGITLNRQLSLSARKIYQQLGLTIDEALLRDVPVIEGGPVNPEVGVILHNDTISPWESSMLINDELRLTSSIDILTAMACGQGPDKSVLALGYAGWSAQQLEQELEENSWLTMPACNDFIFGTPINKQWKKAAKLIGLNFYQYSIDAGHA